MTVEICPVRGRHRLKSCTIVNDSIGQNEIKKIVSSVVELITSNDEVLAPSSRLASCYILIPPDQNMLAQ